MKLISLNWTQLKKLRKEWWIKQNKKCAVLDKEIPYENATLDHKHRKKSEKVGEDGKGLLRGVLDFRVNQLEGKVRYWYIRYDLERVIKLPELLRNLAEYLEKSPMPQKYIHPSEREFEKIMKREYNELKKKYFKKHPNRKAFPEFPKKGKLTKKLAEIKKDLE